jgi:adenylate cyclase
MRDIIDRFHGRVVDTPGDNVLAEFRSAVEAVESAVAIQETLRTRNAELPEDRRLEFRIGVNVGDVVAEGERIYGDAVNLAARLEGANKAFGTGILLSAATAAQLPASVALRALDDVIVKGKTEPVRVFTPCDDAAVRDASLAALDAFHARDWERAIGHLAQVLARVPGDPAALRLQERVALARALPAGGDWSPAVALDKL